MTNGRTTSRSSLKSRTALLFEKTLFLIRCNSQFFGKNEILHKIPLDEVKSVKRSFSLTNAGRSDSTENNYLMISLANDSSNVFELHFADAKQTTFWTDQFNAIITVNKLTSTGCHVFKLSNFGRDIEECSACKRFLDGIFFQGYKCIYCGIKLHKQCLALAKDCAAFVRPVINMNQDRWTRNNRSITLQRNTTIKYRRASKKAIDCKVYLSIFIIDHCFVYSC